MWWVMLASVVCQQHVMMTVVCYHVVLVGIVLSLPAACLHHCPAPVRVLVTPETPWHCPLACERELTVCCCHGPQEWRAAGGAAEKPAQAHAAAHAASRARAAAVRGRHAPAAATGAGSAALQHAQRCAVRLHQQQRTVQAGGGEPEGESA
jgi:hypothetical protein